MTGRGIRGFLLGVQVGGSAFAVWDTYTIAPRACLAMVVVMLASIGLLIWQAVKKEL